MYDELRKLVTARAPQCATWGESATYWAAFGGPRRMRRLRCGLE